MPKQDFELLDYTGPVVVAAIFAVTMFIISFAFINFCCITKYDDFTKFEHFGAKYNYRLGPHSLRLIKKGGFVDASEVETQDSI